MFLQIICPAVVFIQCFWPCFYLQSFQPCLLRHGELWSSEQILVCLSFTQCNSSCLVVAVCLLSREVCGESPLRPNPASTEINRSPNFCFGKSGIESSVPCKRQRCPQTSCLATQFLLPYTSVSCFIFRMKMVNTFPLTAAIKGPCYPRRKWQGEAAALFTRFEITHMKVWHIQTFRLTFPWRCLCEKYGAILVPIRKRCF